MQETVLSNRPDDTETWSTLCKQSKELRQAFSGGMVALLGSSGMLSLEITYGRIGAKDLKVLIEKAKMLSGRLLGLASFQVSAATPEETTPEPDSTVAGPGNQRSSSPKTRWNRCRFWGSWKGSRKQDDHPLGEE
jgi:hypothetical protein